MSNRFWSDRVHQLDPYVPGEQPKIDKLIKLNTNELPCTVRRSDYYIYEADRVLTSEDSCAVFGFTAPRVKDEVLKAATSLAEHDVRELLANTMALPHVALLQLCCVLHIPGLFVTTPTCTGGDSFSASSGSR